MRTRTLTYTLFQTSRPSQLLLIAGVYLFGGVIAVANAARFAEQTFALGAVPLLFLSASVHYANEFADVETDTLTDRTPFSGGSGALPELGFDRTIPLYAGAFTFVIGAVMTILLWFSDVLSTPAVALLAGGTVVGWQYSVRPLKLAWRGLGEVTNAALGGLILPVYGAAVLEGPLLTAALASVPFFLIVLLNLFATQWPDRDADEAVGKRTLAVRWSPATLRVAYVTIALSAGLSLVVLHSVVIPTPVVLASLPTAPLVGWGAWGYTRRHVPWPTVSAMTALVTLQLLGWLWTVQA